MKFWKTGLLAALVCVAFILMMVTTSCEKNVCDNVTCFNGGSCNMGNCRCPVGYEGTQCQSKTVTRFLGVYPGLMQCNAGAYLIDTAYISEDYAKLNYVYLTYKSILPRILHGYVYNNESTYSIVVPDDIYPHYQKIYTVTLQGDQKLTIHTYSVDNTYPLDTIINKCDFVGDKL